MHTSIRNQCLSIVVPCFNEGDGLNAFFSRLESVLTELGKYDYEIVCIDDGSRDNTLEVLCRHAERNPHIIVLELSRNFGKEAALTAGIDAARGDAVILLDADLQHPPELIVEMVRKWESGSDVVLARRKSRETDHPLKQFFTQWFYQLHNWISECTIPRDVGDFRLMDKRVVEALKHLPERRRFMKGLFAWVGFRQSVVEFVVEPRKSGKSSFTVRRLWALALEGITSFSTVPLSVWIYIGFSVAMLALIYGCWIIIKTLAFGIDVPNYVSLLAAVLFLGGIQLMGIGVLGEYIGRIYSESKQRPVYIIRQRYGGKKQDT
ncbi:glycosyltransferase family 2 protein [Nitrosomonas sp. Is37]|uniref:glycosyltransferase family 2 protein n=1 Tax=Nitrosomonas sp. Is37 TaxID=3080535 RepID=UPI00294AF989|nr:glycosyltransferase family 2 protein [Nitrosomonas sp. Is37]MDV6344227.1 glycosyltransferase family 2 protein [Nitrosomonas sp. Is37]